MSYLTHFDFLMKQAEDRRAGHPRLGKPLSAPEGSRHVFRSTQTFLDEKDDAVTDAHDRWMACFNPQDEVARVLCELAFRQRRQLERAIAADDAAIAVRVEEAHRGVRSDRAKFYKEAKEKFRKDPADGVHQLRSLADGIDYLVDMLDRFETDVQGGTWQPENTPRLLAIEGGDEKEDALLDRAVEVFDAHQDATRLLNENRRGNDESSRLSMNTAQARLDELKSEFAGIQATIRNRIRRAKFALQDERLDAFKDEAVAIRRAADLAKHDDSPEARRRRSTIASIQRDLVKAIGVARKACPAPAAPVEAPPEPRAQSAPSRGMNRELAEQKRAVEAAERPEPRENRERA